jgi:hypothetical protein
MDILILSSSRRLAEVAQKGRGMTLKVSDGGQGRDGLQHRGDELSTQAPGRGPGQAAMGERGESSNASTSGSSNRIISRWART